MKRLLISKSTWVAGILALGLSLGLTPRVVDAKTKLKVATLAPPDSSWMKLLDSMNREIKKSTNGEVSFKFYPGGASGDEKDVVRKMHINQLHGGALTAVGLAAVQPEVLVLQLPLLFRSYKELDSVRTALAPRLEKLFEDKGYVILGWGDVGYTYIFSNTPVRTLDDLKKVKMWAWVDDPLGKKIFEVAGITPTPLSVPDVLPSLQTGLINAVYASPLAAIALQWHTKVKYVATMPLAIGIGAMLVSKAQLDKLSPAHQATVKEISRKWHAKLVKQIRSDNKKSVKSLKKSGIQTVKIGAPQRAQWQRISDELRKHFTGKLYSAELLQAVESEIKAHRAKKK